MKLNLRQKKNHPQANLIPDSIWTSCGLFYDTLPDYVVPLMQATEANLFSELNTILPHIHSKQAKKCIWLAIAYSHPNLSTENFLEVAKQLNMSDSLLFSTAAISGNLSILRMLENKHAGTNWLKSIILFNKYNLFKKAAEHGQTEVLKYLISKVPIQRKRLIKNDLSNLNESFTNTLTDMIAADNYHAYRWAAYHGYFDVIQYLENLVKDDPDTLQKMIASKDYEVFDFACESGKLEIFKYVENKISTEALQKKIKENNYQLLRRAACGPHIEMLEYLENKITPAELKNMIKANNYEVLISAIRAGDLKLLKHFESKAPDDFKKMIASDNYRAYSMASYMGYLELIEYLESKVSSQELEEMRKVRNRSAFRWALGEKNRPIFEHLENKVGSNSEIFQSMISENNYEVFANACLGGDFELVKYLESKVSPVIFQEMIKADDYKCYSHAAQGGHIEIMRYLESRAPKEIENMNAASDFRAFRVAAQHHRLDVVKYLENKWPKLLNKMIASDNYNAFNSRVSDGWSEDTSYSNFEVISYLAEKIPNKLPKVIELQGSQLCIDALFEGNLEMLHYLANNAKPGQMYELLRYKRIWFKEMNCPEIIKYIDQQLSLTPPSPSIFHPYEKLIHYLEQKMQVSEDPHKLKYSLRHLETALANEQFEIVNYFLSNPKLFNYIYNKTGDAYDEYLKFFVEDQLVAFREISTKAEQHHNIFDLNVADEIALSFSMLQYLLAKNDASLSKDIEFLLEIPALQTHIKEGTEEIKNLLWQLAARENNKEIINPLAIILEKNFVSRGMQGLMNPRLADPFCINLRKPLGDLEDGVNEFGAVQENNSEEVSNLTNEVRAQRQTEKRPTQNVHNQIRNENIFELPFRAQEDFQRAMHNASNSALRGTLN